MDVWGILDRHGNPWSPRTFETERGAVEYFAEQAAQFPTGSFPAHKVTRVTVTSRLNNHQR